MDTIVINWAQVIVSVLLALVGSTGFWSWLQSRRDRMDAKTRMLLGLCHDKIIGKCEHYMARGWITIDEYEDLNKYFFQPYREAGGNGTAEKAMEEVKRLPIRPRGYTE